jgi:hypothetical protein
MNSLLPRSITSLALVACGAVCCGTSNSASHDVTAGLDLVDRQSTAITVTTVMALEGSYGVGCNSRTGAWAIALNGYVLTAAETPLTVIQDDSGCTLSVTGVKVGSSSSSQLFAPAASIPLTVSYAATGVAFLLNGAGATQFYANFLVTPDLAFAGNFVVQMVYSDSVSETDLNSNASFAVETATATAKLVPAPNDTLSLAGLAVAVDAHNIVKSATGSIALTQGSLPAASYVIDTTLVASPTYASVDAVFRGQTRVALTGQTIPAVSLNLVGLDLSTPQKVNVIVANIANGVNSYQIFEISFSHP